MVAGKFFIRALGFAAAMAAFGVGAAEDAIPPAVNTGTAWEVIKTHWDSSDEAGYAAFVAAIGRTHCASLNACLKSDANPYRSPVDPTLDGDCADMAYVLRAYYAWKNGLPFSYQNEMRTADGADEDVRYSEAGNIVAGRRKIINSVRDAPAFLARIGGEVSTAMFRTHPELNGAHGHDDFYPVAISREAVRPGVIAYDVFGHVGIVYDVLDDGHILIVASHPDNTVTRSAFGPNFMRAKPALGAGIKAWRPIFVEGARTDHDGSLKGGHLRAAENDQIEHYSLEQFMGTHPTPSGVWHEGEFRFQNRTLGYYDYVRRKLAAPDFAYDPVDELRFGLETICGAVKARKVAVDKAFYAEFHLKPHPPRLPPNIYGTYGIWEDYSTPSRDARLKVSFIELRREIQRLVESVAIGAPGVRYDGDNLADDLLNTFNDVKNACLITYRRSDNSRMQLNLAHVMERLFDLSFDPYHCPERRWGARGAELETCRDDKAKEDWYAAQRFLRYQAERTYNVRMDFALDELKAPMSAPPEQGGLGVEAPADADIRAYLYALQPQTAMLPEEGDDDAPAPGGDASEAGGVAFPAWHARLRQSRGY